MIDQLNYTYADSNKLKLVTESAPCPGNKHISPMLDNTAMYAAGQTISADNLINPTGDITYQAGESIKLLPGFYAKAGASFLAKINNCPTLGFETGGYTQRNSLSNHYDINGNLKTEPQKGITNIFNHLDLPEIITFEDGKTINFTYDAIGTLLAKVLKDKNGATLETRDYISGIEYVNGAMESIYHGEGRLHYINGVARNEYSLADHLGNTRLVYSDLNNNGIIETPSEILDEIHYYPNGLKLEGYWMNSDKFRYTFNGIEEVNDFGLGVNMAAYRTLDTELGRWWSVDPRASTLMSLTPYNSMGNSPMMYNDPNGDVLPVIAVAAIIGAGIGGAVNVATHWNKINSFGDGLAAFGIGAAGGAVAGAGGAMAIGAGLLSGLAVGAASGVGGDLVNQIGNAIAFGDQYNINQTLIAGGIGGLTGGLTGYFTVPKGVNPWTGKPLTESVSKLTNNSIDLYSRYGTAADNIMFASGELPTGANFGATKLGGGDWKFFSTLEEMDG